MESPAGGDMERHTVRLIGPRATGPGVPAPTLQNLLAVLTDAARGAVRLRVEGRSKARGGRPAWLDRAASFDLVGLAEGLAQVQIEARTLQEALPEEPERLESCPEVDRSKSALTLLEESLAAALGGPEDCELYDDGLLATFLRFGGLFRAGWTRMLLENGAGQVGLGPEGLARIRSLQARTPEPQQVRVAGRLDATQRHDYRFGLVFASGETVSAIANEAESKKIQGLLDQLVVVSGLAFFRPSGTIRRIEVEHVEAAHGDVSVWAEVPRPLRVAPDPLRLRRAQTPTTGLGAVFGKWPGNESDDEVFAALEALS